MRARSAPALLVVSLVAACSSSGLKKPPTAGASGNQDGGVAGTGAAGTGVAGTGAIETGAAGTAAGTEGGADAAAGASANVVVDGGTDADAPAEVIPALNYQLTGSWPKLKAAFATKPGKLEFTKVTITDAFLAESCAIGDYNKDGQPDISSGRRWYEGPTFKTAHIFRGGHEALPTAGASSGGPMKDEINTGVSDDQSDFAFDVDRDGWSDIINVSNVDTPDNLNPAPAPAPQTHGSAYWYKNPGPALAGDPDPIWAKTLIHLDVKLEQHVFADVDGDGRPELLGACRGCAPGETKGYYQADSTVPSMWTYHPVTRRYTFPFGGTGKLHGIGMGDVDGDGRPDLLERGGAWLQQPNGTWNATVCPGAGCGWISTTFYDGDPGEQRGGSQMYAADFDGDGDADVFSADWAHGYGLAWYEQQANQTFVRHQIMGTKTADDLAKYGPVAFSEINAVQVVDMDGDGISDVVTGKMRFSLPIGYGAPDPMGVPYVYVFKTVRKPSPNGGPVTFEPHLVDDKVGVGAQIGVGHANTDGIVDFCVATKLGLHVFLGQ
jgi:hypothetical protein